MDRIADDAPPDRRSQKTLLINGQRIPLSGDADMAALIDDVLAAVRASGAFVHVEGRDGRVYDALVTPSTHVLICHGPVSFEGSDSDSSWARGIDLDV